MIRKRSLISVCFGSLALVIVWAPLASADEPVFVPDEFIVVLTEQARGTIAVGATATGGPTVNIPSLQIVIDTQGVNRFSRQFPAAQAQPPGGIFRDLTGYYKVKIGGGVDLDTALAAFAVDASVDHVEKIGIYSIDACATGAGTTPNDSSYLPSQWDFWGAYGIDAELGWSIEAGNTTVVVAVLDSGLRYVHHDLGGNNPPGPADNDTEGNVWVNPFEIPGNGEDDDGNGKIDDVIGWDFVDVDPFFCDPNEDCDPPDNDPRDFLGHGTHVAGWEPARSG